MKKNKKIIIYILIIALLAGVVYWVINRNSETKTPVVGQNENQAPEPEVDNLTYDVDGDIFTLKDGKAEKESLPGSVMINSLELHGDTTFGDLDADGDTDAAVWLLNDPGGTGKFLYAALVINNRGTYEPTNTVFLGDRIEAKTLEIKAGKAVYSFLERRPDDPMVAEPTVKKSVTISYDAKTGKIK